MRTILSKPATILFSGFFLAIPFAYSQFSSRHLTRGADTAEIFLSCPWYVDSSYVSWNGLFYSYDNGAGFTLKRQTVSTVECGQIFGDAAPGALFQFPFHHVDTFAVSFDFGATFEPRYFHTSGMAVAGCLPGEFQINSWGQYRGTGYGNSILLQSPQYNYKLQDVGVLPGEVFWAGKLSYNPFELVFSQNYGATWSVTNITLPGLPSRFESLDIHRGAAPGELYFAVWKTVDTVALFHSFDYGHSLTFQSSMAVGSESILYTAGRAPGTFYYIKRVLCGEPSSLHSCLTVYFSRDYGVTFTSWYHDLNNLLTGTNKDPDRPAITVFPNPAQDLAVVRISDSGWPGNAAIQVFDLQGRCRIHQPLKPGVTETLLDLHGLAPGVYPYQTVIGNHLFRGKITIVR